MSYCKDCGREIDWMRKPDGGYIPVDPEPVFVIEGEGAEGVLAGREAAPGEVRTLEEKINTPLGFVPHWRTCPCRTGGKRT